MHFARYEECDGISLIVSTGSVCCGEDLTIIPNSTDAPRDQHLPIYQINDQQLFVSVGENHHPCIKDDYIDWIYLELENGGIIKKLKASDDGKIVFNISGEKPKAIYAHCVAHGLWKSEIK